VRLTAAWRELGSEHRRWLLINAIAITALVNAALNALIAWGSAAGKDVIPLWAVPLAEGPSTITDTVGTFFILPLLTTLVVTTVVWHELRAGRLSPLSAGRPLPSRRLRRGVLFGAVCTALLGPPAVALLAAIDYGDIGVGEFVLYKAIFGVALGAIVTPVIAVAAMRDQPGAPATPQV
jgi:hypothetical protein